jgi:hypothetical protein
MSEHLLIAAIDERLIAIGLSDAALEIVRDDQLRDARKELEGAHMGADPIVELLRESSLCECVVGSAEDGHEDLRLGYFPSGRIDDRDGLSGIVNEHLLAGAMSLAHRESEPLLPLLVVKEELRALVVVVGIGVGILFP